MQNLNNSSQAYDGRAPYHRILGHDWDVAGRPDNTIGYQSGSSTVTNNQSMGIALVGNFETDTPTDYQKKRLGETLKVLMKQYGVPRSRVFLHKEVRDNPTACPGAYITKQFIDILLATPMPTCEQLLEQEKKDHAESIKEKELNYANWQKELDANGILQEKLKQEVLNHKETLAELNATKLDREKIVGEKKVLEQKIIQAKSALE